LPSDNHAAFAQVTDEELAAQIARGESRALEALYDRYAGLVLGISLKIVDDRAVAEDLLQETFWRVWKRASSFQSQRGTFSAWLFTIARNLALDAYRSRNVRPRPMADVDNNESLLDQAPDPNTDIAAQSLLLLQQKQIRNALATLPFRQRQVIEMAYFYGMTRQEIAEVTGEALGTIHTRARLALQKLREELRSEEFDY
jgi:RNA polymerase sigma-70 factor (ECF subfamily)